MTPHEATVLRRAAAVRELHSLERSQAATARALGVCTRTVANLAKVLGLKFRKSWAKGHQDRRVLSSPRADAMAALYRDGYTLAQIGEQYGLTRERVRQILAKQKRMDATDGGQHVRAERLRSRRKAALEAKCMEKYGCTLDQWRGLIQIGRKMRAEGYGQYQTPLGAYRNQRMNAKHRGIAWEFTVWSWWTVWQLSGHWAERGRGQGYCMCRKGDGGPYAVGNVFIAKSAENSREGSMHKRKDPELPIGVTRTPSGKFLAKRHLHGKPLHLGVHATPELAYAAYLMADQREAA